MDDLELKDLGQYYDTESYSNVLGFKVTDGIGYIMQNGYSWFVTDFLAVAKFNENIKKEEFVVIRLELDQDKGKMIVSDGNEKILYTQNYKYTDAKRELTLYLTDKVLMLNGEY